MLGLVVATNLFQMYFFWELVGVCSYFLIGFWWTRVSAAEAALKAFKKRLKVTRLDAESSVAGGPLSSGRKADIVSWDADHEGAFAWSYGVKPVKVWLGGEPVTS